ncbi:hypothetical protein HPP92_009008 [Vanilla planifolia]|uniref:Uncharacterized protein n=1 Tax=Vanilla planifolia TaxID=51239 RepID=A0A835V2G3_VANPL|nr:hypothetical protein HPP92_009008 [Vanilla planifolia]
MWKGWTTGRAEGLLEEIGGVEVAERPTKGGKRSTAAVMLEGYIGDRECPASGDADDHGCLDLGFGFNYEEIPGLCGTLPALELCYSMSQRFLDEQQLLRSSSGCHGVGSQAPAVSPPRVANWKISSPGLQAGGGKRLNDLRQVWVQPETRGSGRLGLRQGAASKARTLCGLLRRQRIVENFAGWLEQRDRAWTAAVMFESQTLFKRWDKVPAKRVTTDVKY